MDKNQHHQGVENEYNSYVSYHHGIICKQHQHPFLLFCHCYAPRGFFVCIDAISHLSTGDRNDKLRLRDRLTHCYYAAIAFVERRFIFFQK